MLHIFIIFGVFLVSSVNPIICSTECDLQNVPAVFASDNFPECKTKGNSFCRITFSLQSLNNNTITWREIKKSRSYRHCFSRDVVYRFRCLPNELTDNNEETLKHIATQNENDNLKDFPLKAHLNSLSCYKYPIRDTLRTYDYIVMIALIGYFGAVTYATILDFLRPRDQKGKLGGNLLSYFSILSQWIDLKKPIGNPDYNQMKCVQGIRTYTMTLVIIGHTISSGLFSFVTNEKYLENFFLKMSNKVIINGGLMLVQTNFMISGWLTAKMVYNEIDRNGKLTFRFIMKRIFLKYMGFLPVIIFVIALERSKWKEALFAPAPINFFEIDNNACQKNWFASLLLINNFLNTIDMCHVGLWYLSNNFQFYVISLMIYYFMFKFKIGQKMIIFVMTFFWSITFCSIYFHNITDPNPHFTRDNSLEIMMSSYQLYILYTCMYINYGSFGVGLLFGYWFHRYKNQTFHCNKVMSILWLLMFFGLPSIAIYSTLFEYSRLATAILLPTARTLFSLGIAIGIFGMIKGMGGIIKTICEWKFAEFIARWSYSTFLVHFFIVFGRYLFEDGLRDISDEILIKTSVSDVILSFIAGLFVHLTVERPMAYVFSFYLPDRYQNKELKDEKNK
ncbi:O-acyltransferase like protein-like [Leptinotarsa decemlineata]|uniref:O-acyltransferase like protein-like n=1 Tax=Leptinotarsa decemlineata TaxID=7539 RepID=UPI003D30AA8E